MNFKLDRNTVGLNCFLKLALIDTYYLCLEEADKGEGKSNPCQQIRKNRFGLNGESN